MAQFMWRVAGAFGLDAQTYEDVEADRGATFQATAVVLLASVATGIGFVRVGEPWVGVIAPDLRIRRLRLSRARDAFLCGRASPHHRIRQRALAVCAAGWLILICLRRHHRHRVRAAGVLSTRRATEDDMSRIIPAPDLVESDHVVEPIGFAIDRRPWQPTRCGRVCDVPHAGRRRDVLPSGSDAPRRTV